MKKLLLSAAIVVLGFTGANAQDAPAFGFAEGDVIVEGNVSFNSSNNKNNEVKSNFVGVMPKAGFFLKDDLAVGVSLSVSSNKNETAGTDTFKSSGFGVGVFGRYYFLDLGARFKTFTELGIGYSVNDNKIPSDVKINTIGAGLDLGLNYFVTEKIALTFVLDDLFSFSSGKSDADGAKAVSSFNLGVGNVNSPFGAAQFGVLFKF